MNGIADELKQTLIGRLRQEACSCLICQPSGLVTVGHERGVRDLFRLLADEPQVLRGAFVADKVVGKGAAALMVLGGVAEVYAGVISLPALELLERSAVAVSYGTAVPNIINRAWTGICPVESLCADCRSADECLPLIEEFIRGCF